MGFSKRATTRITNKKKEFCNRNRCTKCISANSLTDESVVGNKYFTLDTIRILTKAFIQKQYIQCILDEMYKFLKQS